MENSDNYLLNVKVLFTKTLAIGHIKIRPLSKAYNFETKKNPVIFAF